MDKSGSRRRRRASTSAPPSKSCIACANYDPDANTLDCRCVEFDRPDATRSVAFPSAVAQQGERRLFGAEALARRKLDAKYLLVETEGEGYRARAVRNVRASDASPILNLGELEGGSLETLRIAVRRGEPVRVVSVDVPRCLGTSTSCVNGCASTRWRA